MCELDLVKNMVNKLDKLAVFDLNLNLAEDLKALNTLTLMNKGTVLVVMPIAYTEQLNIKREFNDRFADMLSLPLTSREQDTLTLIAGGMTNKSIAYELGICDGTVKVHVKNMMRKLNVRTRLELAIWALGLESEKNHSGSHKNERD